MYNIRTSSKGRTQCRIPDCPTAQDDIHNSDGFLLGSFDFNNLRINQQNSSSKDDLSWDRQDSSYGLPKHVETTNAPEIATQGHHKVSSARHSCLPPVSPTAKMMYGGNRKYISVQRKRANRTLISDLVNAPDAKNAKLQSPVNDGENASEPLIQLDSLSSDMKLVQSIKEVTSMMTESKQLNPLKTTTAGTSKPPLPPKRSNTARMTIKQTSDHQIYANSHTDYEMGKPHTISYKPVSWNIDGLSGHVVLPTTLPGTIESREKFWVALHNYPARPNFPVGPSSTYVRPWEKTKTMPPPIVGPPSSTLVVPQPTSQMEKRPSLYSTVPYGFPACVVAPGPDNVPHTSYLGLHVHGHLSSRTVPRMGVDVKSVNQKNVPVTFSKNPVMVGRTVGETGNAPLNKTVYQIPHTKSVGNKLLPTAKEHSLPPFKKVNLYQAKESSLPPLNRAQKMKETSPPIIRKTNLALKVKSLRPGTPKRQVYKTKPLCQSTPISYVATGGTSRQTAKKDNNTDHNRKGVKPQKLESPSTPVMKLKRHWTPAGPYHDKMSPSPRPRTKTAATLHLKLSPKSNSRYATDVYAKLIATAHKKARRSPQSSQRKAVTGTELPFTPKRILSSKIRSKAFKLLNGKHQVKDTEQKDSALKETRQNMETKSAEGTQVIGRKGGVENSKCGQKDINKAKSNIDINLDDLNPLSKTSPTIDVPVVKNVPVSSAETSLDSGVPNTTYNRNIDKNLIGQKPHKAVSYENKYSDISSADSEVTTNFSLKNSKYPSPPTLQKNNITPSESLIQNASDVSPPVLEKCGKCVTDNKNIEQPVSKSNTETMSCDKAKNVCVTGSCKDLPMGSGIHDSDFESFGSISLDSLPGHDNLSDSNPLGTSTMESLNVNGSLGGSFVDDELGKRDTSAGTATDTDLASLDRAIAESLHKMLNFQFRCKVPMHRNVKKFELSNKLKHVKPYLISGYVSETYLKTLAQRTHKMNLMFGNALDEVGDVDQSVLKKCQKSSPAILAKDLVFRVFTLAELNNGMVMSKLSGVKLSAVRRCVRREFPKMEVDDWALQCLPYIKNALKTLFTQRVPMVQQFWEKM